MADLLLLWSALELLLACLSAVVAIVAWGYRTKPTGRPLFAMAVAATVYSLVNGAGPFVTGTLASHLLNNAKYPMGAALGACSFYVAVEFAQRAEYRRRGIFALLVGFVVADAIVSLTDPVHYLVLSDVSVSAAGVLSSTDGPLFRVHVVGSVTPVLFSLGILVVEYVDARGIYRKQTAGLTGAILIAVTFFLWQTFAPIHPAFDLGTIGIFTWCVLVLWALFRADFLETAPVARATLMESMDDAVVALDTDGHVVDLNPTAQALLGVDDDAVGALGEDVFADYPTLVEQYGQTLETRTEISIDVDGQRRHFDLNISPVRNPSGEGLLGRIVVIRDVTEKERQRRELDRKREQLERQNRRLDKFASVVSHDLRNPLGIAETYLEFARDTGDEPDFEAVEEALDRMNEMIDGLLTMARADTAIEETEQVDIARLSRETWETTQTDGATLEVTADDTVEADPDLLRHVFVNLFRNTVEHGSTSSRTQSDDSVEHGSTGNRTQSDDSAEDEDPPVRVTVGTLDDQDGFFVADDGQGIPPEEREAVFDHGHTTTEDGTGLGLSIVSEFVQAHGWEISVTESSDGGARFDITTDA
jgi:PAS domain S-box-containing protein